MKTKNMFWAALSMTAALVMTACSSDDSMTETPVAPSTSKTIPYTVTVGGDEATTRATVDGDNKTLKFATGDKLYITGTDIKGVLDLKAGDAGKATGATFSGELTYSGSGSPADNLSLTATLVSAQQTVGTQVSVDAAGAVTVNYPTAAYCATISDAVQQYSRLTGTSTYGAKAFTLTQQTAFLNFAITFEDGTTTGTELSAVVSNNSAAICTANVTTTTESEKVVAKFVLPVTKGTTLSSANVKMGSKAAISFGASQTLDGKVYNVTKTQAAAVKTLAEATAGDIGMVVCAAGHLHLAKTAVPSGCTAVGILGKVTETGHGLILALENATQQSWHTINSWTSVTTYAGTTLKQLPDVAARGANLTSYTTLGSTAVSDWCVAQKSDYEAIFTNLGSTGTSFDANVNAYITTGVGGTAMSGDYWSATKYDWYGGWYFYSNYWYFNDKDYGLNILRPVLAF
ncbi:MAG: hypothetical protein K6D37_12490 [Prevotella sp.]|nr:hypothetical protein [Prevotella sp.]